LSRVPIDRRTLLRLGPPVAFLLAATVAVLLVRSALHHHHDSPAPAATRARTSPVLRATTTAAGSSRTRSYYRIQSGDTFSSVAVKFNTTVEELQALNAGVDPHVLTVGQRIRVR
jgi:LysM repeat protein